MLVRLVDDVATAFVPVARISAITTGTKLNWRKEIIDSAVVSKTRLQVPLSLMNKLASARVLL